MAQTDQKSQSWWDRFMIVCERLHAEFVTLGVANDDYWIIIPDLPHHYTSIDVDRRELVTPELLVACSKSVEHENGDWGIILGLATGQATQSIPLLIASGGGFTTVSREPWVKSLIVESLRRMGKGDLLPLGASAN